MTRRHNEAYDRSICDRALSSLEQFKSSIHDTLENVGSCDPFHRCKFGSVGLENEFEVRRSRVALAEGAGQ